MPDDRLADPAPTATAIVRPIVSALVDCSLPDFLSFVRRYLTGFARAGLWCDYRSPHGHPVRLDRAVPPVIRLNKRQTRATIAQDAHFVDGATGEPVATVNPVLKGEAWARAGRTEYRLVFYSPPFRAVGTHNTLRECYRQLPWEIGPRFDVTDLAPLGWWGLAALPPFEPPRSPAIEGAARLAESPGSPAIEGAAWQADMKERGFNSHDVYFRWRVARVLKPHLTYPRLADVLNGLIERLRNPPERLPDDDIERAIRWLDSALIELLKQERPDLYVGGGQRGEELVRNTLRSERRRRKDKPA